MISTDEFKARECLKSGTYLIDPKFLGHAAEEKLKVRCRACWHLREYWPSWVKKYAEGWAKEKGNEPSST